MNTERAALTVFDDAASLAEGLANHIVALGAEAIERRGRFDIALAGGSTPQASYTLLQTTERRAALDWSLVRFFFGDERCVPPDDRESNYKAAKETLLDPLQIRPHAVFRMLGEAEPEKAAQSYVETLKQELGAEPIFDLVLLGMGPDGHTASLFPGTDPTTDDAELVRAPWVDKFSTHRITITPHVINGARNVAIAVAGSGKAEALAAVLDGPQRPSEYPIQIVAPRSGHLVWFVDRAATAKLQ